MSLLKGTLALLTLALVGCSTPRPAPTPSPAPAASATPAPTETAAPAPGQPTPEPTAPPSDVEDAFLTNVDDLIATKQFGARAKDLEDIRLLRDWKRSGKP